MTQRTRETVARIRQSKAREGRADQGQRTRQTGGRRGWGAILWDREGATDVCRSGQQGKKWSGTGGEEGKEVGNEREGDSIRN